MLCVRTAQEVGTCLPWGLRATARPARLSLGHVYVLKLAGVKLMSIAAADMCAPADR